MENGATDMTDDSAHLLERSRHEAVRAIQSPVPVAAGLHQELCLLYVIRAVSALRRDKVRRS